MYFTVTDLWKATYPGAFAGVLVMRGVTNPARHSGLEAQKEALVADLRTRLAALDRAALKELSPLPAYEAYYRAFKKTYHVQLQLESILFKGKTIPSVAALVEAMFMAEVKNMLLTAGHDLDTLRLPVVLDAARGSQSYTLMRGTPQELKPGDMFMVDGAGILSSILYGPDQRSAIREDTRNVIFTVYAPPGIGEAPVAAHLSDIQGYVQLVSPAAQTDLLQVYSA